MNIRHLLAILLIGLSVVSCQKKAEEVHSLSGTAMGTTWELSWRGEADRNALPQIQKTLEKWEQVLSQWRPTSDLSRHNNGEPATPELQRVTDLAHEIEKASAGAFNARLLKETSESGFGPEGKGLDLSGIGKGFAVDRVVESLRADGFTDFIFELGGEVFAAGGEWEVGIESPETGERKILRKVKLQNQALATSGNYRQFKPAPVGLTSHIIDPSSRTPVIRQPSSVSVIATDCATADAWATALFVLGSNVPAPAGLEATWNEPAAAK